jgi:D-beta-D-heptose 7-phosphate kinase/D-beta-D-heptose 1-phosphate adenosyltransferase
VLNLFKEKKIIFNNLFISQEKKSTLKNRIMCGIHQLIRIDSEDVKEISRVEEKKVLKYLSENISKFNIVILSDYAKGFITKDIAESTIKLAKKKNIKVLVDPSLSSSYKYKNAFLIKPNKKEAEYIVSKTIASDYSNLIKIGREIKNKYKSNIVVTLGKDGILIIDGKDSTCLIVYFVSYA